MRRIAFRPFARPTLGAALACAALAAAGCGGGGGGTESRVALASNVAEEEQIVVEYDHDGDDDLDVLTLDPSHTPMVIVEALEGDGAGALADATAARKGRAIDAAISDALAQHLATSLSAGEETELFVIDSQGREVLVKVLE